MVTGHDIDFQNNIKSIATNLATIANKLGIIAEELQKANKRDTFEVNANCTGTVWNST